ncbi:LppX_LprAFG lipoprotein [Streptomyces sp. NPDC002812]|uniref:LppX_LprAFG lipoprotein n=1 Tax=Streptomyces sp. NPDC002812 TaxID=3154434 RepID=UPI0033170F98
MKASRFVGVVAATVLVGASSVGCSAGAVAQKAGESAQLVMALAGASEKAASAGSAEISMTMTSPDTAGKAVNMKGLYSWGSGLAMEVEVPAADLQLDALAADGTVMMRLVDGAYYYEVDPFEDGPFKGKSWLKVDAAAVLGEKGAAGLGAASGDPTAGLKTLKYARNVTTVGTESINGKSTVHYRAEVPADKLGVAADMYENLGLSGQVVTDVWVDGEGAPARLNQQIGTTSISLDFLKFGIQKRIEVPPAADTADMTEIFKQQDQAGAV